MGNFVRLREERERLGLSQAEFGERAGVTKQSQHMYEAGKRSPDSNYLTSVALQGVDVLYVITGRREPPPDLTAGEMDLVYKLRAAPAHIRATVHTVLGSVAPASVGAPQIHAEKIGNVSTGKIGKIVQHF